MDNNELWPEGLIDVTDRLVIREFTPKEAELCRDMYIRCGVRLENDPASMTPEEFAGFHSAYIKYQYGFYGYGNWLVSLRHDDSGSRDDVSGYKKSCDMSTAELMECSKKAAEHIGIVGLVNGSASQVGELSYALLPEYRGYGYAHEACLAAMEYGRECGFERFEARIASDNLPSLALANKLGITIITY